MSEPNQLLDAARAGNIVVLAGAGVSAGKPSALPGWKPLNDAIAQVLRRRLDAAIQRSTWLEESTTLLRTEREADLFPPEYQAELIHEMCGDRYFRGLQALDIDVPNAAHSGIANLAAAGALKAVVTTNFDRLIEHSLDKVGVKYDPVYDAGGFARLQHRLTSNTGGLLHVVKIHGCVSDHLSMVDTLKQRKRGRSHELQACLEMFFSHYWLYLGFSAADLSGDPNYLGLTAGARRSAGATYIAFPGAPQLGKGAQILMNAYGNKAEVVVADLGGYLAEKCTGLSAQNVAEHPGDQVIGLDQFDTKLQSWADQLSAAAAGLCLAAMLEAVGHAELAVRLLDRLVRHELRDESDTPDFRALQLHYGRLGAAWGRFVAVPDMAGNQSNATVESFQSLCRLLRTEAGFAASGWLTVALMWMNRGKAATSSAVWVMGGFADTPWGELQPRTDEEAVDAWLSAAQTLLVHEHGTTNGCVSYTFIGALDRAKRCGDVVRAARVEAVYMLAQAPTTQNLPALLGNYQVDLGEANRVGDRFAAGICALALGRWYVGPGGLALAKTTNTESVANEALKHLDEAIRLLQQQGMDPWVVYALIQRAKALADLRRWDEGQKCIDEVLSCLGRFPVWESHLMEAVGQGQALQGSAEATQTFQLAIEAAARSGLDLKREGLQWYLAKLGQVTD